MTNIQASGLYFAVVIVLALVWDVVAVRLYGWDYTVSSGMYDAGMKYPWLPPLVAIFCIVLLWHFFLRLWPFGD